MRKKVSSTQKDLPEMKVQMTEIEKQKMSLTSDEIDSLLKSLQGDCMHVYQHYVTVNDYEY